MSHLGISPICELDDVFSFNEDKEIHDKQNPKSVLKKSTNLDHSNSYLSSQYGANIPELSLEKCRNYNIGKDCFTEIVLLTVIAYFCVSTEQRFINMSIEKEAASKENNLNNSINSQPHSNKSSAGIGSNNLSSNLQTKSTKA